MWRLKKLRPTEREMTTHLFLLRCVQLGISMADMELLSIGLINDMYSESRNDEWKYCQIATQEDMDRWRVMLIGEDRCGDTGQAPAPYVYCSAFIFLTMMS